MPRIVHDGPLIVQSMQNIPLLCSDKTLTFNTGTSCRLIWSEGGNSLVTFQSQINDLVNDVHRGRKGDFLDDPR
jgi:hypothetical protein